MYRTAATIGLVWLLSQLLWGCSDEPLSPEARLRQIISEAESSIQTRQLADAMGYIHPGYQDKEGRDIRQLRAMLAGYFLRHKSIHVLTKIEQIDFNQDGSAQVVLFAGLAGALQEGVISLDQWHGDLIRLQLNFVQQGEEEWLLRQADWRRARSEDFIR